MILDSILRGYSSRLMVLILSMLCLVGILGMRVYSLQVKGGDKHLEKIRQLSIRQIIVPPVRGRIISSDGEVFADNRPSFNVYFHIHEMRASMPRELRKQGRLGMLQHVQNQISAASRITGTPSLLTEKYQDWPREKLEELIMKRVEFIRRYEPNRKSKRLPRESKKVIQLAYDVIEEGSREEMLLFYERLQIRRHLRWYTTLPLKAFEDIPEDVLARLNEAVPKIQGMEISCHSKRVYPFRNVGPHIIGYVGKRYMENKLFREERRYLSEFEQEQLKQERRNQLFYYPEFQGKAAGKTSIEKEFDHVLSGEVGHKTVLVNSLSYFEKEVTDESIPAKPGSDLVLTIDSRAQTIAQRLLEGKRGALVCLDIHTGAIIALVSAPTFDITQINSSYGDWARDKVNQPLLNRALEAGWTPGSVVKPLVALSVLEKNIAHYDTQFNCVGYHKIGSHSIHCHYRSGHGHLNILQALEVSCNPYFINMGLQLGVEELEALYGSAGIGKETGIELRSRYFNGTCPGRDAKNGWNASDTAHVSIGQGHITMSPLHAATYTAAIANGGLMMRPHLIKSVKHPDGTEEQTVPQVVSELPASQETLRMVRAGMYKVVYGPNATAKVCRSLPITIAGKTGTAEMGSRFNRYCNTWFVSFAPYENPKYSIVVFVEHGKGGGSTSAPIVRAFLDEYLRVLSGNQLVRN